MRQTEEFTKNLKGATKKQVTLADNYSKGVRYTKNGKYMILDSSGKIVSFEKVN